MKKLIGAGVVLVGLIVSTPVWAQPARPDAIRSHRGTPAPAEHVDADATMTEQMRIMGSDSRMAADPMWAEMRDSAHIAAEEHMQAGLDRMLAR